MCRTPRTHLSGAAKERLDRGIPIQSLTKNIYYFIMIETQRPPQDTLPSFYREAGLHGTHVYLPELVPSASDLVLKFGNRYAVKKEDLMAAFYADPFDVRHREGTFLSAIDYLKRDWVVKMMRVHQDAEYFHRFAATTAVIQQINSSYLARIEASTLLPGPDGQFFPTVIMPYYNGISADRLGEGHGAINPLRMADAIQQIGYGLDLLHFYGVIHSDVAPKNILLLRGAQTRPQAVLIDYGASYLAKRHRLHPPPAIWSTPKYMAPELNSDGGMGTFAADQYSLALTAEELLERTPLSPFTTLSGLLIKDRLPKTVANVISKATAPIPDQRFGSAGEFGFELYDAVRKHVAQTS